MTDIAWQNRIISFGSKPADQFQANERNWRKHPTAQQEVMRQSLRRVGWVGVVLENVQTGNVVDGHERIWEALDHGNADVPFIQVDLTPDEEAFVLATFDTIGHMAVTDGAQLASLLKDIADNDASLLELTQTVADEMGVDIPPAVPDAPDAPIDRAAELQVKWNTSRGQVWQVGRHRVMCGDSTSAEDVATLMGGVCADIALTDPPYGIKRDEGFEGFGGFGPPIARRQYADDWDSDRPVKETFDLILSNAKNAIIFGGNFFADLLPRSTHWIVWDKLNTMPTFGDCELAWTSYPRQSVKKITLQYNGLIGKEQERYHPTQKPVALFAIILSEYTEGGNSIYDAFLGSGTTAVAAEQLGRVAYGMEIAPQYVAVTLERLSLMGLVPELL